YRLYGLLFMSVDHQQMAFDQYRTNRIVYNRYQDRGNYCIKQSSHSAEFCKGLRQFLRLSQNKLLVKISNHRIGYNIKGKSCYRSDHAPLKHIFFICTFVNMSDPVSYQSGDQSDTKL